MCSQGGGLKLHCQTQVAALVGGVIPTRVQLTFAQLQNFMADVAIERGLPYFFWGHADVALLSLNETASFAQQVLGCGRQHCRANRQCA